jgi:hypothetical protein
LLYKKKLKNLPNLPLTNNYCTKQRSNGTSTLIKRNTTRPTGSTVHHDILLKPSTGPRTNKTRKQIVDTMYDMDDDSTVVTGNISASAIHGEISAIQDEVSAKRQKKPKTKAMTLVEDNLDANWRPVQK